MARALREVYRAAATNPGMRLLASFLLIACATVLAGSAARAGQLTASLKDLAGQPVANAVVAFRPASGVPAPARTSQTYQVTQADIRFNPFVLIVPVGAEVQFPNKDKVRHHVYSFSPAGAFEFVIAPGDGSPPVTLERPGDIAVGCNIHDRMTTHLYISDATHIARSGADGRVVFDGLPAGTYHVQVWHPQLRPGRAPPGQAVTLGAGDAKAAFALGLLPDPREGADDPERARY